MHGVQTNCYILYPFGRQLFEVTKAVISARMLSGPYRTDYLARHWSRANPEGLCQLPGCNGSQGDLQHILLHCPALVETRKKIILHWSNFLVSHPWLFPVVAHHTLVDDKEHIQFLLDPSALPMVILGAKSHPKMLQSCFYLARTWNFSVHLAREKIRKHFNISD